MRQLRQAGATLLSVLREIFDESAYRRFLRGTGQAPSRASYSEFLAQRYAGKPRPRCC
jgi:hypothetical protein